MITNVSQNTNHPHSGDGNMSHTDLDVLVQACRNVKGRVWTWGCWGDERLLCWFGGAGLGVKHIRAEYNRLIRLKKSKKRWKA